MNCPTERFAGFRLAAKSDLVAILAHKELIFAPGSGEVSGDRSAGGAIRGKVDDRLTRLLQVIKGLVVSPHHEQVPADDSQVPIAMQRVQLARPLGQRTAFFGFAAEELGCRHLDQDVCIVGVQS